MDIAVYNLTGFSKRTLVALYNSSSGDGGRLYVIDEYYIVAPNIQMIYLVDIVGRSNDIIQPCPFSAMMQNYLFCFLQNSTLIYKLEKPMSAQSAPAKLTLL